MSSATVIELTSEETEQVVERLRDPELDAAAADLLGGAYDAYQRFARQAPNLLRIPDDEAEDLYSLVREVGNAHAADLAMAASLIDFAAHEWSMQQWELKAPIEALGVFTMLAHAFYLISSLRRRADLERALRKLPSLEEVHSGIVQAPVKAWLANYQVVPALPGS